MATAASATLLTLSMTLKSPWTPTRPVWLWLAPSVVDMVPLESRLTILEPMTVWWLLVLSRPLAVWLLRASAEKAKVLSLLPMGPPRPCAVSGKILVFQTFCYILHKYYVIICFNFQAKLYPSGLTSILTHMSIVLVQMTKALEETVASRLDTGKRLANL